MASPPDNPTAREYTAMELAGDWWWVGRYAIEIVPAPGGRLRPYCRYETATAPEGGNGRWVQLRRMVIRRGFWPRTVVRSVGARRKLRLISIARESVADD